MSNFLTSLSELLNSETKKRHGLCDDLMRCYNQSCITSYHQEMLDKIGVKAEFVDRRGGEGQGDVYFSVIRFSSLEESVLVKFRGYWTSHEGADYYEWSFVQPIKVEVTEYV